MPPPVSPAAGKVVESRESTRLPLVAMTLKDTSGSGGVPSPKSTVATPLKLARPPGARAPGVVAYPHLEAKRTGAIDLRCAEDLRTVPRHNHGGDLRAFHSSVLGALILIGKVAARRSVMLDLRSEPERSFATDNRDPSTSCNLGASSARRGCTIILEAEECRVIESQPRGELVLSEPAVLITADCRPNDVGGDRSASTYGAGRQRRS